MTTAHDPNNCYACGTANRATPQVIDNRPGLSRLNYRVGTYSSFRHSILLSINSIKLGIGGREIPILQCWTARGSEDFGIALMEMWAYVAGILTFYQERIANEAFIRTAIFRESLLRLASMLDYIPAPGVAAMVDLAFTLQEGATAHLRAELRSQSVPGQDEKPQKFELQETIEGRSQWNQLTPISTRKEDFTKIDTQIYLEGTASNLRRGDAILIVSDSRKTDPNEPRWYVRFITNVQVAEGQALIILDEAPDTTPDANSRIFVFRRRAALFGFNAPDWLLMSDEIKNAYASDAKLNAADLDDWPDFDTPPTDLRKIDLNNIYPNIVADSWVALQNAAKTELYLIEKVSTDSPKKYTLTAQVTSLEVDKAVSTDYLGSNLRRTVVFTEAEELTLGQHPIGARQNEQQYIEGNVIVVEESVEGLESGRKIIISGKLADSEEVASETAIVSSVSYNDPYTTILLQDNLNNNYERKGAMVFANVARVTHGETIASEVLGNGDASIPFQSFTLSKAPVTYVPEAGAPNGAANTLEVYVNDVRWEEVRNFYGHSSSETVYTTRVDNEGEMTVRFGNGKTGARVPTGRNNIVAKYRHGIGSAGNVRARTIKTLLDRPLGLKSVINPAPAEGGTEPESIEMVRANAPNTVRTFGRIVSLHDFADAAREFAGIAKARAEWVWDGEDRAVELTVAGDDGKEIQKGSITYQNLLNDLNSRRDINRKMRLCSYDNVPIRLEAAIFIEDGYLPGRVKEAVRQAVIAYFAFDNVELGQTVHISDIYQVMQNVAGVKAVDINVFRFKELEGKSLAELSLLVPLGVVLDNSAPSKNYGELQRFVGIRPNQLITLENEAEDLQIDP